MWLQIWGQDHNHNIPCFILSKGPGGSWGNVTDMVCLPFGFLALSHANCNFYRCLRQYVLDSSIHQYVERLHSLANISNKSPIMTAYWTRPSVPVRMLILALEVSMPMYLHYILLWLAVSINTSNAYGDFEASK